MFSREVRGESEGCKEMCGMCMVRARVWCVTAGVRPSE